MKSAAINEAAETTKAHLLDFIISSFVIEFTNQHASNMFLLCLMHGDTPFQTLAFMSVLQ
jgi:hypothetical protein